MPTLNACPCPRCGFFLGYSTTRPAFNNQRTIVIGSCLNCDYRLPVRAVLRGKDSPRLSEPRGETHLSLVQSKLHQPELPKPQSRAIRNCARELRAVGQALEQLQLKNFHLKLDEGGYLIWHDSKQPTYRLSSAEVERIERNGRSQRSQYYHPVNGHRLSHLLRTLGAQIERRGQRLLGLTWRATAVNVVVKNKRGELCVEPLRSDILYDLWVRMYLRRAH